MPTTSLLTDMYELTMVKAALHASRANRHVLFELFPRRLPQGRSYGVVAGVGRALAALADFRFGDEEIDYLLREGVADDALAEYLAGYRFHGDIVGYPEGELYFGGSPLLQVEGSFAEVVLLETLLLSIYNHDCAIAAAASRMTMAAQGRPIAEFGARRTHEASAVAAARAAWIAGFSSTSDLEAGRTWGIPVSGTAAHAFTMLFDSEAEAFGAQLEWLGEDTTLLVDTYDVAQGVANAVEAARAAGGELGAVRLDSGDLVAQAFKVRGQLDAMGATSTRITVTSDLDEYAIAALGAAPVDSYGVGTRLVTGSGVPTAALVYKVVAREDSGGGMVPVAKKSESKSTVGGMKVAGRVIGEEGYAAEELLLVGVPLDEAADALQARGARPLQIPLVVDGRIDPRMWGSEALARAQERHIRSRNELPYQAWRLSEGETAIPTRYEKAG